MKLSKWAIYVLLLIGLVAVSSEPQKQMAAREDKHLLYVAVPGIRNYVEYGGIGILVYDMSNGHRLVKRIPTWEVPDGKAPENIKGIVASAKTGKLYLSTPKRLACFDLITEKMVWDKTYEGGADRMAMSPDGKIIYLPSFEGPHWNVVDASTGDLVTKIETKSGAHNTIIGLDGKYAYLAGLKSPLLPVVDTRTHTVTKRIGPFSDFIRPFTVNKSESLCFVNINKLLGFEVGDLKTGKLLHRVEVAGYAKGSVKRHGCPSHGIALTPDEKELWLADGANSMVHVFDATVMPPRQMTSLKVRDQPGWITFSIDGRYAYPSTGEVFDARTKRLVTTLQDEQGRPVQSEKMVEVVVGANGRLVRAGDQFGLGRKR